jgi:hypothetical protein
MRKRSKVYKRSKIREKKYNKWNEEIERIARGWNNRGSKYSRIRRTRGNTRKSKGGV